MFIGDGAKMVRDAFALAKEKAPAIIFIDELDAIGTKVKMYHPQECHFMTVSSQRFASEKEGDREVQRTMLELLNQLDGFSSHSDIKVGGCALFHEKHVISLSLPPVGHRSYKQSGHFGPSSLEIRYVLYAASLSNCHNSEFTCDGTAENGRSVSYYILSSPNRST